MTRKILERSTLKPGKCERQLIETEKGRLFVDMDGTLAEWRTISVSTEEELYRILKGHEYYRTLKPYINVVEGIRHFIQTSHVEVYIASCYFPDSTAKEQKNDWLNEFLPEIPEANRIFIPVGERKAGVIPGGVKKADILLDDFTQNLLQWPGLGIKLINPINHTRRTWKGGRIGYEVAPEKIAKYLEELF